MKRLLRIWWRDTIPCIKNSIWKKPNPLWMTKYANEAINMIKTKHKILWITDALRYHMFPTIWNECIGKLYTVKEPYCLWMQGQPKRFSEVCFLLHFWSDLSQTLWSIIYKASRREYKVINVLAICQKLNFLWHFEILAWESKNHKMCNILKTADHRVKRMKIWDSGYYSTHM